MSISAVLIVKNEAHHLRECLETLTWADEIVVLDAGSQDETCAIAR
nr:glycosyltransferase [Halomonas lionensis]